MTIQKATQEHLDKVYNLICILENKKLDEKEFAQMYLKNLQDDSIHYYVATHDDDVIGFASLHIQNLLHHCGKICEVQELIVSEAYQGAGIGGLLLTHMKKIATANDCMVLEVSCNRARERSHKFYEKEGLGRSHYKFTFDL